MVDTVNSKSFASFRSKATAMDRAASIDAPEPRRAIATNPRRTFGLTGLAVFLVSLDATVMVAAFPALRADFAAVSTAMLSWTLNAYTIVYAALLVPAGRMADLLGRKRLFLWGVGVFTLSSALLGAAAAVALVGRVGASLDAFRTLYVLLAGCGLAVSVLSLAIRTRPATPAPARTEGAPA